MNKTDKQIIGRWGEDQASFFLTQKGYKIISRNYLARGGELDIIAWHKKEKDVDTLCFVEVKTRQTNDGSAERATHQQKLHRLFHAAKKYCLENKIDMEHTPIQFEQISVYKNDAKKIEHYVIPVD